MNQINLKPGHIVIRKRELKDHCNILRDVLKQMDIIMKEPESFTRGKKIAEQMNRMDYSRQVIERHLLDIPLNKLGYDELIK